MKLKDLPQIMFVKCLLEINVISLRKERSAKKRERSLRDTIKSLILKHQPRTISASKTVSLRWLVKLKAAFLTAENSVQIVGWELVKMQDIRRELGCNKPHITTMKILQREKVTRKMEDVVEHPFIELIKMKVLMKYEYL